MIECVASASPNDWKQVRHWLLDAVATADNYEIEDLYYSIMMGQTKLWLILGDRILKGAATSTIEGQTCTITFAGGIDGLEWAHTGVEVITQDARDNHGTTRTKVVGRKGWQPTLSSIGFKHTQSVFVRDNDGYERHSDIQSGLRRDIRGSI